MDGTVSTYCQSKEELFISCGIITIFILWDIKANWLHVLFVLVFFFRKFIDILFKKTKAKQVSSQNTQWCVLQETVTITYFRILIYFWMVSLLKTSVKQEKLNKKWKRKSNAKNEDFLLLKHLRFSIGSPSGH